MESDGDPARPPVGDVLSPPTGSLSEVRRIGEGGSADVYAAVWHGRDVAMKVAKASAFESEADKERFVEEARRLSRVRHPGVIEVLDTGELDDGRPYLLMPLLEGEPLADRIDRGPVSLPTALSLFADLAEAVEALHAAGLIHRDLKPGNVFLPEGEARPVLLDLGIAKDVDAGASTLTKAGVIRGTPAVMAPERFFGTSASVASDVYELAVILYAMIAGRLPWDNPGEVEARLFPRPLDEIQAGTPTALVDVLMEALSTRPERRPSSAADLASRATQAASAPPSGERLGTEKVTARSEIPQPITPQGTSLSAGASRSPTRRTRRAAWAWAMAGTLALGGLIAATINSGVFTTPLRPASVPSRSASGPAVHDAGVPPTAASAAVYASKAPEAPSQRPPGSAATAPASASAPPSLPTPSWALPRRTRHHELTWCNQIVDSLCDPELFDANANARKACRKETAHLKRIESGPRSAWERANEQCHHRIATVRSLSNLERSGRWDEVMNQVESGTKAAASAFPSPSSNATLDAWLQRMPFCRAYAAFFCSPKVRAHRGDFGCHAARNAAQSMARNAARHGPDTIDQHDETCRKMLDKDRAAMLAEIEIANTLHPDAGQPTGTKPP